MIEQIIPIHVYKDSRSLYHCPVRIIHITEKWLLIDLRILRRWIEICETPEFFWIPTAHNIAYAFIKATNTSSLKFLLEHNRLDFRLNS